MTVQRVWTDLGVIHQNERKLSSSSSPWQQTRNEKMNSLKNGYNGLIIYRPGASHQESGKRRDKNSIRRWNMWTRGSYQRNRQLKECLRGKLIWYQMLSSNCFLSYQYPARIWVESQTQKTWANLLSYWIANYL